MMFVTEMKHLTAVVLERDVDRVTKELLSLGLLHFVNVVEIDDSLVSKVSTIEPEVSYSRISELKKRVESLLSVASQGPASSTVLDLNEMVKIDIREVEKALDGISRRIEEVRERQRLIQLELLKFQDIKRQVELFGDIGAQIRGRARFLFLTLDLGSIPDNNASAFSKAFTELPAVLVKINSENGRSNFLRISMKKDESRIRSIAGGFGWQDMEMIPEIFGVKEQIEKDLDNKIVRLRGMQTDLADSSKKIVIEKANELLNMWKNIRLNELYYKVQSYYSKTGRTVVFSGWLPESKQDAIDESLGRVTQNRCYLEWNDPSDVEKKTKKKITVPVKFSSPRILAPFQMLVKNFGIPEYGSIDPTPFVAIAYLIMFGLMFSDLGQGAILLLLGIFGTILFKKTDPDFSKLTTLIIWCGSSSMFFGLLFGSFFGTPIHPLWFNFHEVVTGHAEPGGPVKDIYGILFITIMFGISVIGVGLVINWINLIHKRKWFPLLLEKRGILGGFMYGAGIYIAFYMVNHGYKEFPPMSELVFIIGIPALIFVAKPIIEFAIHKKTHKELKFDVLTPINFIMEWVVEMLEIFSGYLANTLSFMRVAGLGIAHVSLMVAFFTLADMAGPNTIWSVVILVVGNVLVIALEGLSAGIQSLRLNYYEFFSKYFTGTGIAYSPVTLKS
jgi:V/A-type H+-transporting ATPase subunit I